MTPCKHETLIYHPSSHAAHADYRSYTPAQLRTAAGRTKNRSKNEAPGTFPAPLILPGDDLALDPRCPPQSFRSWLCEKDRNDMTPNRRVVYVVAPPKVDEEAAFVSDWSSPRLSTGSGGTRRPKKGPAERSIPPWKTIDVIEYLAAFCHGMPVRQLPFTPTYAKWDNDDSNSSKHKSKQKATRSIALNTHGESVCISTRASPDDIYPVQLSLDDIIDVGISILPEDAYALLMLIEHDLFEDEDDDFCCGRAYGGSRVAVVSSARYNPLLDAVQGVEREHAWPASHCAEYVRNRCADAPPTWKQAKSLATPLERLNHDPDETQPMESDVNPMQNAIRAHLSIPSDVVSGSKYLSSLWLLRLTRTASHELGHCFGIDHCVYFACIMQGTASMVEDVRQPPYLCPIDQAKIQRTIGLTDDDLTQRYENLQACCRKFGSAFAGFDAWLEGRINEQKGAADLVDSI